MISTEAYFQIISTLPPLMLKLLKHEGMIQQAIALEDEFNLKGRQGKMMMELEASIIAQEFPPSALLTHVKEDMGMDEATARRFTAAFLGRLCLPMQWYIGSVEALIKEYGGNVEQYVTEAKRIFPEMFGLAPTSVPAPTSIAQPIGVDVDGHPVLHNFDERVGSLKGRAEVLLRLTGLSSEVEGAMQEKKVTEVEGEQLLKQLDGLSYAVNTKDLNALEVEALRRGIKKVLRVLAKVA